MQSRLAPSFILGLIAVGPPALAQPPSPPASTGIDHQGFACIVVGKYPKLKACFGGQPKEPRAYFHAEGDRAWYWVRLAADTKDAPEPYCLTGVLPKPGRKLLRRHVEYYLEDVGAGQRTKEYDPLVVRYARECKKDAPVAPISPTGPTAVFPAMPAGFTAGTFPTAAVGVLTAGAAGAGVYLATKKDEKPVTPTAPVPPPPAPVPPALPPPPPPTTLPARLDLSCQAEPKSGLVPLTVTFTAFASGGTGTYDYAWMFGDGSTGVGRHPIHTYTSAGSFNVLLTVTSGELVRQCERTITVNAPAPPPTPTPTPTPTTTLTLTIKDNTDGVCKTPDININPPNKNCPGVSLGIATCSQTYASGTVVTLTPSPTCKLPICWLLDCKGTPSSPGTACTLTMDKDKNVGAEFTFDPLCTGLSAEPPVSLAWSIDLEAPGAVGQAVVDGQFVVAESGQHVQHTARSREGEVAVVGHLVRADGKPGTWRFEAQPAEAIEPGSLRVLQGDVALLTPTAVVFRLRGQAGERVSFSYRLRR